MRKKARVNDIDLSELRDKEKKSIILASDADDKDLDTDWDEEYSTDGETALLAELHHVIKDREQESITERKKKLKMIDEVDLNRVNSENPLRIIQTNNYDESCCLEQVWDEDVVFKNQSVRETKKQTQFINDTVRNDFHM